MHGRTLTHSVNIHSRTSYIRGCCKLQIILTSWSIILMSDELQWLTYTCLGCKGVCVQGTRTNIVLGREEEVGRLERSRAGTKLGVAPLVGVGFSICLSFSFVFIIILILLRLGLRGLEDHGLTAAFPCFAFRSVIVVSMIMVTVFTSFPPHFLTRS